MPSTIIANGVDHYCRKGFVGAGEMAFLGADDATAPAFCS